MDWTGLRISKPSRLRRREMNVTEADEADEATKLEYSVYDIEKWLLLPGGC